MQSDSSPTSTYFPFLFGNLLPVKDYHNPMYFNHKQILLNTSKAPKSKLLIFYVLVHRKREINKSRKLKFCECAMIHLLPKEQTESKSGTGLSITCFDFIICSVRGEWMLRRAALFLMNHLASFHGLL